MLLIVAVIGPEEVWLWNRGSEVYLKESTSWEDKFKGKLQRLISTRAVPPEKRSIGIDPDSGHFKPSGCPNEVVLHATRASLGAFE